ncbi:Lsr2 family protein [Asanoa sp. WMMD1127]|uniref:histone-like nucleoid-structuring protein Lsr2 n=1 Tax=Asanoa sp. WMMD1127 TaxID=3016107 RepID=UPI0024171728|nr:Lsr2 family protein [Asanoa sp. WMMD1127]MDG4826004.1 Lsr2 family protein [Asanoa sp. WMMD1127]
MAKQIIHRVTDDLDGSDAEHSIEFALDGVAYSIDLNDKNATEFREIMSRYVGVGERLGRVKVMRVTHLPTAGPSKSTKMRNDAIRAWAKKQGKEISDRGRIPAAIEEEYDRAH